MYEINAGPQITHLNINIIYIYCVHTSSHDHIMIICLLHCFIIRFVNMENMRSHMYENSNVCFHYYNERPGAWIITFLDFMYAEVRDLVIHIV